MVCGDPVGPPILSQDTNILTLSMPCLPSSGVPSLPSGGVGRATVPIGELRTRTKTRTAVHGKIVASAPEGVAKISPAEITLDPFNTRDLVQ